MVCRACKRAFSRSHTWGAPKHKQGHPPASASKGRVNCIRPVGGAHNQDVPWRWPAGQLLLRLPSGRHAIECHRAIQKRQQLADNASLMLVRGIPPRAQRVKLECGGKKEGAREQGVQLTKPVSGPCSERLAGAARAKCHLLMPAKHAARTSSRKMSTGRPDCASLAAAANASRSRRSDSPAQPAAISWVVHWRGHASSAL